MILKAGTEQRGQPMFVSSLHKHKGVFICVFQSSQPAGVCVGGRGSYVNVSSFRNEELHHLLLAEVCDDVHRLPPSVQGPVHIFGLKRHI